MKRVAVVGALCAGAATGAPEQVFITRTGNTDEMMVSWVTMGSATSPESVAYGTGGSLSETATGSSSVFDDSGKIDAMRIHTAKMTGLKPNTEYAYQVEGGDKASFVAAPERDGGNVYAVLADFGYVNDVALSTLLEDASAGAFDSLIHAGDFAYNFQDDSGKVGNQFMNSISPAVSTKPYFTTPGNHEADDDMFGNYIARFAAQEQGLGADSGSGSNLYYSWNEGPAHFVAIDTEMWAYGATAAQIKAQQAFLEADLAAVDRSVTPWVIGYGHKAGWMDNIGTGWTDVFDPLFAKNVDLYFCGHTHNYQRTVPAINNAPVDAKCVSGGNVYHNCTGTAFIVAGSPGCKEKLSTGTAPKSILQQHIQAYGYGKLKVNTTHLEWTWTETVAEDATGELAKVAPEAARSDYALFIRA